MVTAARGAEYVGLAASFVLELAQINVFAGENWVSRAYRKTNFKKTK